MAIAVEGIRQQVADIQLKAAANQHQVKIGVNGFVIARDSEKQAQQVLQEIVEQANPDAVKGFAHEAKNAGNASPEGEGNWAKSTLEDLVQYNDGFKTNLIGTPQQIAERIIALKNAGVSLMLLGFLHFQEEVEFFGREVMPRVRELGASTAAGAVAWLIDTLLSLAAGSPAPRWPCSCCATARPACTLR